MSPYGNIHIYLSPKPSCRETAFLCAEESDISGAGGSDEGFQPDFAL